MVKWIARRDFPRLVRPLQFFHVCGPKVPFTLAPSFTEFMGLRAMSVGLLAHAVPFAERDPDVATPTC